MYEANKLDILKMMQENCTIFGKEICEIIDAKEGWIIRYFEKQLIKLLDHTTLETSKYARVYGNGWSITNVSFERFKLNIKQCADIGNFIIDRIIYDNLSFRFRLSKEDTVIVLDYIDNGGSLTERE